eukprot:168859-Karenia_brevis.AAC.1
METLSTYVHMVTASLLSGHSLYLTVEKQFGAAPVIKPSLARFGLAHAVLFGMIVAFTTR